MKFSIIVPTFDRLKLLDNCIRSLLSQDYPKNKYEVIIIDDGSTDNTANIVESFKKKHSNVRYYKIKNSGPAIARNLGLKKAKGNFIAFTDDDCTVEKEWLRKIEIAFNKSNADAVGGSIVNPTNRYIAWAQYILNLSSWFPGGKEKSVQVIPTGNVTYREASIKDYFFPTYLDRRGYSDSLFCYGLYEKKKKILFCPDIRVKHHFWDMGYGIKAFFSIQKRAATGFCSGGYIVHGKIGKILMKFKLLNLLCPRLFMVFLRCIRQGYLMRFLLCFPLIFFGEFYRNWIIIFSGDEK